MSPTPVFSDDFSGTGIDRTKWSPTWFGGTAYQGGTVSPSNVTVANGYATLQTGSDGSGAILTTNPHNGDLATGFEFGTSYTVEARIKLPGSGSTVANWPAFWTDGQNWPANGETDIVEGLGTATSNYHSSAGTNNSGTIPGTWAGGWHTYTLKRYAGRNDIYWDGSLIRSYTTDDGGAAHYLLLDDVRGDTNVAGSAGAMLVDYVRVWKQ